MYGRVDWCRPRFLLRNTSLSRRVRTLVRFPLLIAGSQDSAIRQDFGRSICNRQCILVHQSRMRIHGTSRGSVFTVFQLTNYSVKALAYLLARRLAILSNSYAALPILPQSCFRHNFKATANRSVNVYGGATGIRFQYLQNKYVLISSET